MCPFCMTTALLFAGGAAATGGLAGAAIWRGTRKGADEDRSGPSGGRENHDAQQRPEGKGERGENR